MAAPECGGVRGSSDGRGPGRERRRREAGVAAGPEPRLVRRAVLAGGGGGPKTDPRADEGESHGNLSRPAQSLGGTAIRGVLPAVPTNDQRGNGAITGTLPWRCPLAVWRNCV